MASKFEAQIETVEISGDHHEQIIQPDNDSSVGEADNDARAFEEWESLPRSLRIVVTGKTGAGKSTLLNGFIGGKTRPFKEGEGFDPETLEVKQYTFKKHNVEVTVWDCPGLQDGTQNEEAYLEDLKEKTNGDIDIMLYCISMADTRFDRARHGMAMQYLTQVFGRRVWRHTVIILTFANSMARRLKQQDSSNVDTEFEVKVNEWKTKIQGMLCEINCTETSSIIDKIQVVPAGFKKPSLPGRKFWLSNVWEAIFFTLKTDEAKVAAIKLNEHRFRTDPEKVYPSTLAEVERPPPITDEDFKSKDVENHPIVVSEKLIQFHRAGAEIVAISSIGAVAGATLGGIIAGAASLGIATPVGAGVGGLIGGGVGFAMSALFRAYMYKRRKAAPEQTKAPSHVTLDEQTDANCICNDESKFPPSVDVD